MFLRFQPPAALFYVLAVLALAATTGGLYLLRDALSTPIIALFFLLPVVVGAAGGLGPGLMAAFCAFLAFNYFFIEPLYTLVVHRTQDVLVLIVFLVVAVIISQLVGRAQQNRAMAEAREREATHLYTLSTALAGFRHNDEIAQTLGTHFQEIFQPLSIEILIQPAEQAAPVTYTWQAEPLATDDQVTLSFLRRRESSKFGFLDSRFRGSDGGSAQKRKFLSDKFTQTVPLATPRSKVGEIRLRLSQNLNQANERLLQAFANQGALAVERTALAQAETRARVLEESDRLKSALLSSVSHELRTPLATIKAAATSLRSGDVRWESPARADLLGAIDEEVDLVNRLVGNLLDMSRIESGALQPKREWNLLAEIAGGVITRMRQASQHHRLEVDIPEDLPLAPVDYTQLEQVFTNLISNSLKYAPAGTTVRLKARVNGEMLHVQVSNEGPPVPPEHLERIFDKFYRVTAANRVTGTGLGLSICKGIIEAHGGQIWAENLPDCFAFNFTLPLRPAGMPPPALPVETDSV